MLEVRNLLRNRGVNHAIDREIHALGGIREIAGVLARNWWRREWVQLRAPRYVATTDGHLAVARAAFTRERRRMAGVWDEFRNWLMSAQARKSARSKSR
jgi:hypothetical protein